MRSLFLVVALLLAGSAEAGQRVPLFKVLTASKRGTATYSAPAGTLLFDTTGRLQGMTRALPVTGEPTVSGLRFRLAPGRYKAVFPAPGQLPHEAPSTSIEVRSSR